MDVLRALMALPNGPMRTNVLLLALLVDLAWTCAAKEPVILSGDMESDFRLHAASATCCAVERMPSANLLASWKKLGVRMLKRIPYDPDVSAEYFRRKAGFLAFVEGADGLWLEDEAKYPESWRVARAEAEKDRAVADYLDALADRALTQREKNHKVWIEGRRVKWMFHALDYYAEDLDCLRLDYVSAARRLEQLLGLPQKVLAAAAVRLPADTARTLPLADRRLPTSDVSLSGAKEILFEGLTFSANKNSFAFELSGGGAEKGLPGSVFRLRFDIPGKDADWLAYECVIDLSLDTKGPQAPLQGPVFASERFGKGHRRLYGDGHDWRCEMYLRRSNLPESPALTPSFSRTNEKDGRWTASVSFGWLQLGGLWPMTREGERDRWCVRLLRGDGTEIGAARLVWPKGNKAAVDGFVEALDKKRIAETFDGEAGALRDDYSRWYSERLYGFAETPVPTLHRFGKESDALFADRVLEPFLSARRSAAERLAILPLAASVSRLRLAYLKDRAAGCVPSPVKRKAEEAVVPDADRNAEVLNLEEKGD